MKEAGPNKGANLFGVAIGVMFLILFGYVGLSMLNEHAKQPKPDPHANDPLTEQHQEELKRKILADVMPSPEEQKVNERLIREAKKSWRPEKLSRSEEERQKAEQTCKAARLMFGNLPIASVTPNQMQLLNACQVLGY